MLAYVPVNNNFASLSIIRRINNLLTIALPSTYRNVPGKRPWVLAAQVLRVGGYKENVLKWFNHK